MKKKNSYDEIKDLLKKSRLINESVNNKNILKEQEFTSDTDVETENTPTKDESGQYDDVEVINDVEIKLISQDSQDVQVLDNEKQAISNIIDTFRQQVSQVADLDPGFTITETQVRLDGNLPDYDLKFVFVAGEQMGFYLISEMSQVDDELVETLKKMSSYYNSFRQAMEPLVRNRKTT